MPPVVSPVNGDDPTARVYVPGTEKLRLANVATPPTACTLVVPLMVPFVGADASPLRAAGYAFQFQTATAPAAITFTQNGPPVSVQTGSTTRLYGGAITDINHDGWIDFIAVNEVSADLRVLLNTADGTGLLGPVLTPPEPKLITDWNG